MPRLTLQCLRQREGAVRFGRQRAPPPTVLVARQPRARQPWARQPSVRPRVAPRSGRLVPRRANVAVLAAISASVWVRRGCAAPMGWVAQRPRNVARGDVRQPTMAPPNSVSFRRAHACPVGKAASRTVIAAAVCVEATEPARFLPSARRQVSPAPDTMSAARAPAPIQVQERPYVNTLVAVVRSVKSAIAKLTVAPRCADSIQRVEQSGVRNQQGACGQGRFVGLVKPPIVVLKGAREATRCVCRQSLASAVASAQARLTPACLMAQAAPSATSVAAADAFPTQQARSDVAPNAFLSGSHCARPMPTVAKGSAAKEPVSRQSKPASPWAKAARRTTTVARASVRKGSAPSNSC